MKFENLIKTGPLLLLPLTITSCTQRVEDIYELSPDQVPPLEGKAFISNLQGLCSAGTIDRGLVGDALYINCVKETTSGDKAYYGAIFGNTINTNGQIKDFRRIATTEGGIFSGDKGYKFLINREDQLTGGDKTVLSLNNCFNQTPIAYLGINSGQKFVESQTTLANICVAVKK